MKKFTLFFASLYLTTSVLSASTADVLGERSEMIAQSGNIRVMELVDSSGLVIKVFASGLNICDDSVAGVIGYPRPLSVSDTLSTIAKLDLPPSILKKIDIDLSINTICDEGASLIGKFFRGFNSMNNIKTLDLSCNRITDGGIFSLLTELKTLLLLSSFECLRITRNYGANMANIHRFIISCSEDEQSTIRRKIEI